MGSVLATSAALPGGSPLDKDYNVELSEIPVTAYVSSCSPTDAGFQGWCEEAPLDLNGDGKVDMMLANGISQPAQNIYYRGRGTGAFSAAVFFGPERPTSDIKFADLDGDGDVDMVEATRSTPTNPGPNYVYTNTNPGNGAGSFAASVALDSRNDRSSSVAIGDVDNDGDLDLVFSNERPGDNSAAVQTNTLYLNESTGPDAIAFGAAIELDAGGAAQFTRRLVLFDADNDGDLDIIATSASQQADGAGTGNVIYVNQTIGGGTGIFAAAADLTPGLAADDTDEANSIAIGDIDGDDVPDLVFSNWQTPNRYYINNGGLNFNTSGTFGGSEQTSHVRLADLDNDGDLDAAVTTTGDDNRIHLNTLGGSGVGFIDTCLIDDTNVGQCILRDPDEDPSGGTGYTESRHLSIVDLNADGYLDILVANRFQLDLRFLNSKRCNTPQNETCNPFRNNGQTITQQLEIPIRILPDTPWDVLEALPNLAVTDIDNVYPSDHSVRITQPTGADPWTCTPAASSAYCEGTTIEPNPGFTGAMTVKIRTTDGFNTSGEFNLAVEVNAEGNAPAFTSTPVTTASEDIAYTYNITAQDVDGDSLTIDSAPGTPLPAWLTLTDNGNRTATLTGTPTSAEIGLHDVSIRVRDGNGNTVFQPFTIEVSAGAPTITSTALTAATEGVVYTYNIAASDPNGDDVTLAYDAGSDMPAWLTLTDAGDGTATLTGTPAGTDIGASDIVLIVTDTTMLSTTQAFTLTVASAADAPSITLEGDNPLVLTEGDTFVEPGYSADDAQDGDLTADVVVTGTVDTATVGTYTLTYTVQDSAGNVAQVTRDVEVEAAGSGGGNTDPVLTSPGAQTARVGQSYSLNIASNATDADGDTLTFSATGLPSSLTLSASGTLSGTPVSVDTANSPYTVNVTVDDGNGGTDSATFTLTISPAVSGGGGSSGGGGAFGLLDLLLLLGGTAAAGLRRRLGFGRA